MQCLTDIEFSRWLSNFGVKLIKDDNLKFCGQADRRFRLLAYVPKDAEKLYLFASWLARWLPKGHDRVLWLKHWMTYPPDHTILFERLRRGCGESRPLGESPGHLFGPPSLSSFEERTLFEIEEDVVLAAMILFVIHFDWDVYILADNCDDYVYLSDGYVSFSSPDQSKISELSSQLNNFECTISWVKPE
ncbi:MAG: hypothetical protein ACRECL_15035 [Bradyrhizobium sp.]